MKFTHIIGIAITALGLAAFSSCTETTEDVDHTYDRWQERNDSAFHAIYQHAQKAISEGSTEWKIYRSYATTLPANEHNSIVVHIAKQGTGSGCPMYTDSVRVNYQGCLFTGKTFDHSGFYNDSTSIFSPQLCKPASMLVSNTVEGFTTALQYMHIGDLWRVYIPYQLGYGASSTGSIRAYSMLRFDVQLRQYARKGEPLPAWK